MVDWRAQLRRYALPLGLSALMLAVAAGGEPARALLRYDRAALAAGEAWRLLSGHLVQLGAGHLLLNLAGLWLVWLLCGGWLQGRLGVGVLCAAVLGVDAGLYLFDPGLSWYVGLSGALHGLLAAGVWRGWRGGQGAMGWLLLLLGLKLAWEQLAGPLPGSEALSGGPVVVDAHLYGTSAGLLGVWLLELRRRPGYRAAPPPSRRGPRE